MNKDKLSWPTIVLAVVGLIYLVRSVVILMLG